MTLRLSWRGLVAARGGRARRRAARSISGGEALVVTGANGAGKSTLLRTLAGLLPPGGGTSRSRAPSRGRRAGAASRRGRALSRPPQRDEAGLDASGEARASGALPRRARPASTVEAALDAVGLPGAGTLPFGYLSAGQQRRAAIARLLVARRPVWILDEPTSALDARSQALLRRPARGAISAAAASSSRRRTSRSGSRRRAAPGRAGRGSGSRRIDEADLAAAEGWRDRDLPAICASPSRAAAAALIGAHLLPRRGRDHALRRRARPQAPVAHRPGDPVDRRAALGAARRSTGCSRPTARTARSISCWWATTPLALWCSAKCAGALVATVAAAGAGRAACSASSWRWSRRRSARGDADAARRHAGHHLHRRGRRGGRGRAAARRAARLGAGPAAGDPGADLRRLGELRRA